MPKSLSVDEETSFLQDDKLKINYGHPTASRLKVDSLFSVRHLNVLITGGGSGIGAMLAATFVENGSNVMICSRKEKPLKEFADKVNRMVGHSSIQSNSQTSSESNLGYCWYIGNVDIGMSVQESSKKSHGSKSQSDSGQSDDPLQPLIDFVKTKSSKKTNPQGSGYLDVLINNAGTNYSAPIQSYSPTMFKKVMDVNLSATFALSQKMLPLMGWGTNSNTDSNTKTDTKSNVILNNSLSPAKIINITSINGEHPPSFETYAYSASKAGLKHLTKHMAARLGGGNSGNSKRYITVNAIAPGSFPSRMMRGTIEAAGGEDAIGEYTNVIPRVGNVFDIGGAGIWLTSRAGDWVTGSVAVVDGGALVKNELSRL